MTIWTLTVDDGDQIATTVHHSQAAVFAALRANYDAAGQCADLSDGDMTQSLIDTQGLVIYIGDHEMPVTVPAPPAAGEIDLRRVVIERTETISYRRETTVWDVEQFADTTLAQCGGDLTRLLQDAMDAGHVHEWIERYGDTTESETTIRFAAGQEG